MLSTSGILTPRDRPPHPPPWAWWSPHLSITQCYPELKRPYRRSSQPSAQMFAMRKCSPGKASLSDQLQAVPTGWAEASVLDMLWVRCTLQTPSSHLPALSPWFASSLHGKKQPETLELLLKCSILCELMSITSFFAKMPRWSWGFQQ